MVASRCSGLYLCLLEQGLRSVLSWRGAVSSTTPGRSRGQFYQRGYPRGSSGCGPSLGTKAGFATHLGRLCDSGSPSFSGPNLPTAVRV